MLNVIEQAVAFGAVEGYVRPFLAEGPEVKHLLLAVKNTAPAFINCILGLLAHAGQFDSHFYYEVQGLEIIESLSERELEILKLLAAGLSNDDISKRLFISLGTVKWHVKNIFGKLVQKAEPKQLPRPNI